MKDGRQCDLDTLFCKAYFAGFTEFLNKLTYLPEELPWLDYIVTHDYQRLDEWLAGYDPRIPFSFTMRPIEHAANLRDRKAVELMLARGHDSTSALGLAEGSGFDAIVDLIREHERR